MTRINKLISELETCLSNTRSLPDYNRKDTLEFSSSSFRKIAFKHNDTFCKKSLIIEKTETEKFSSLPR